MNIRRLLCAAAIVTAAGAAACGMNAGDVQAVERNTADIYYIDKNLITLVPMEINIQSDTLEGQASEVIAAVIEGKDYNENIRRFLPKNKRCMKVRVDRDRAYVDITRAAAEAVPDTYEAEVMTVYSIVNSLTSIEGINTVRFRVDGREANPFRHIDLRETFIPDYINM